MSRDVTIRPYEPGDEATILAAWNRIFPDQDGLEPRGRTYWSWQFRDNPLRSTEVIVAVDGDTVVGQYTCIPLAAVDREDDVTIGLVSDVFVLPEYRRSGGRPGLIIQLARRLHESYCGARAELRRPGHVLLYGYPYPIWRIAQRYLASEMVRDMDVLFRELEGDSLEGGGFVPSITPEGVVVEQLPRVSEVGDALWRKVRPEIGFGVVRDGSYLDWRYVDHPGKSYTVYLARDASSGEPRGLAVYVVGRYVTDGAAIVCDWLVPRADAAAEEALLAALEKRALEDGAPVLLAVFPQNDSRFLSFQRRGFLVGPPSHFLVMNSFKHHVRTLRDLWYFTLGDSDLV